ncbi:hypothetical protein V6N11_067859 [Hibiscus sabdariffa]|uniref:Uncharacterized protein n=1 Tax=Hibiscus sabdariffa TaxID=183260 RepID=A0ABR2SSW8_9ROSI
MIQGLIVDLKAQIRVMFYVLQTKESALTYSYNKELSVPVETCRIPLSFVQEDGDVVKLFACMNYLSNRFLVAYRVNWFLIAYIQESDMVGKVDMIIGNEKKELVSDSNLEQMIIDDITLRLLLQFTNVLLRGFSTARGLLNIALRVFFSRIPSILSIERGT